MGMATFPSAVVAREIATILVTEGHAVCCNLIPGVESIYRWKGNVESAAEVIGVFKFRRDAEASLRERLLGLHPYEVAEWICWPVAEGSPAYLDWVKGCGV